MKSLQDYIFPYKKEYKFVVKLAATNPSKELLDRFKNIMESKYRLIDMSEVKSLPFQINPVDFVNVKDIGTDVCTFELTFELPVIDTYIREDVSRIFSIEEARISVRNANSPVQKELEAAVENKDKDYVKKLSLSPETEDAPKIDQKDYVGNGYVEDMLKTLNSKESKEELKIYKSLDESVQLNEMKISVDDFNSYSTILDKLVNEYSKDKTQDLKQFIIDKLSNVNFIDRMGDKQRQFINDFIKKINDPEYTPKISDVLGKEVAEKPSEKKPKEKTSENFYSYGKTIAPISDIKKAQREKAELLRMKMAALRNQKMREGVEEINLDKE